MGARAPDKTLIEDWSKYTSTETCIDFTAQFLFPAQSLAQTLPPDMDGPLFSNIAGTPNLAPRREIRIATRTRKEKNSRTLPVSR